MKTEDGSNEGSNSETDKCDQQRTIAKLVSTISMFIKKCHIVCPDITSWFVFKRNDKL